MTDRYLCRASDLATQPDLMALPEVVAPPCGVAGRVTLLTHGPKGGKSSTGAAIVADAARRGVLCAILTLDEAMADTLQRLVRYGAPLDRVWLAEYYDLDCLDAESKALNVQVLIVDHLGKLAEAHPDFGPGSQGDPLLWGRLVSPFTALARARGLAVILLDQAKKSDGKYAGSVAKAGSVDLLVEMKEKDGGLEATPRGRIQLPPFRVELDADGVSRFSGGSSPASPTVAPDAPKVRELLQLLSDSEPDGLTTASWLKESGQAKQSFLRHRKDLHRQGYVLAPDVIRRGARWRVSDAGEKALGEVPVPSVPLGTNGTKVPTGGIGTNGPKPLVEGLDLGTSRYGGSAT